MTKAPASLTKIDVTTLRLLLAAIDEGNFAKAAARENIAVSAISRRISDLENRLDVKLLERHDRGVRATPAAEAVLDRARAVLGLVDQIVYDLQKIRGGSAGVVRVQAHMTAATNNLYDRVAAFADNHPEIDVRLDEATSIEILHAVRVGTCDLGLVSGTLKADDVWMAPWSSDQLVAVLPPNNPLCGFSEVDVSQLAEYPFIGMQRDSALLALFRSQAELAGKKLVERSHSSSFESVRRMVEVGLGVGILPGSAAYPFARPGGFEIRPLNGAWASRPLALCVRDIDQCSAAVRLLIDHLTAPDPQAAVPSA